LSFEVTEKDLLGRIGRLRTKSGTVETPLLLPVVNPVIQPISPKELSDGFGCRALIANAFLLKKNFGEEVIAKGVHGFLGFNHVVFTDSGAYQILIYGDIEATQEEIVAYEEAIDTDVATILDVPTGGKASRERAEYTVEETLRRARAALSSLTRKDILWIGPIQGGNHLDLVAKSASEMANMPFQIYALGSPTEVMERYIFNYLVDMVMTAKMHLPPGKPLHLFGAGHPFMLSLAVAMGCDIFDSAAYAIYARGGKYMTNQGTERLENLEYFPCACRICSEHTPSELLSLPQAERTKLLAWHNLELCFAEIRNIKQAIKEGRLWELVELRAMAHPSLLKAFKNLSKYSLFIEENSPVTHTHGIFYFGSADLTRPEIVRHHLRLEKWKPPEAKVLVLIPETSSKPFHRSREVKEIKAALEQLSDALLEVSFCVYAQPFGVIPLELDETYPLSQYEAVEPPDCETKKHVAQEVVEYIRNKGENYEAVVIYIAGDIGKELMKHVVEVGEFSNKLTFLTSEGKPWKHDAVFRVVSTIIGAWEAKRASFLNRMIRK
jgi:7-cyano-7-deazaguanine tRNA-ribosyltransferase